MENRERRVGVGHLSEPRSQSLPKRKRTPSAGGPSHASSSREGVTARSLRDDLEGAESDEQPEEAADEQKVVGLYSVGLSDTSVLDCPVCFEPLTLPVFQCGNGHVLCSSCREAVKQKCPSCSKKIGDIRCRAIEGVLESVKAPCPYKSYGCPIEMRYSSKRSHEEACAYAPYGCPFNECSFVGCPRRLSLHLNNSHASSIIRLSFDHVCPFSMSRAEMFVVFREEVNGTLFIVNQYDRMKISCIDGSNLSVGDRFAYALIVRGKDSCLRFQSFTNRFETTPTGKGVAVTIGVTSKDFIQVPSYLFDYDGCLRLELCIWSKGAPCVDIARGGVGEADH